MVCTSCIQAAEDEPWPAGTGGEPADLCSSHMGAQMSAHGCIAIDACACSYLHTARAFYQTMIFVQVLSQEPVPDTVSLAGVAREIVSGDYSGKEARVTTEVDGPTMAKLLKEQGSDPSFFGLTEEIQATEIKAECHSDDHAIEHDFNAAAWFEQASAEQIVALANCGWRGDYPADAVAHFMADHDDQIAAMFSYIEIANGIGDSGFECSVAEESAMSWLAEHRPEVHEVIRRESD